MRAFSFLLAFFVLTGPAGGRAFADVSDSDTLQDIAVSLVSEDGQASRVYLIPQARGAVRDVLFRATVDPKLRNYRSAVFEVTDASKAHRYRLTITGPIPPVIHWDGRFSGAASIEPNQRYFMRLVLNYADGKELSSPWAFFGTRRRTAYDDARRVRASYIDLYVIPTGAMHMVVLSTPTLQRAIYPNVFGDIQLIWKNTHSLVLKLEATSNILFGFNQQPDSIFYSDISFGYRFRLAGAPIRPPVLPADPPFGDFEYKIPAGRSDAYGQPFNAEVAVRLFSTTIRGAGNQALDGALARQFQGATFQLWADHAIDRFRLHLGLEGGYSAFRGKLQVLGGEVALTYEQFFNFAPGLQFRYYRFTGTPENDTFTGLPAAAKITNTLALVGIVMKFKL